MNSILKFSLSAIVTLGIIKGVAAQSQSEQPVSKDVNSYILLKGGNVVDVISNNTYKADVFIKNDKIEKIYSNSSYDIPKGTITLDVSDEYIVPGYIDGHVHITHGTQADTYKMLEDGLKQGIVAVRDMSGDGRILTSVQRSNKIGETLGADVYFATLIGGEKFFVYDKRPESVAKGANLPAGKTSWQRAAEQGYDYKQIVAEAKGIGATALKFYLNVDAKTLKELSDEAKKQGLMIWSHVSVPPFTRPSDVVKGGADVVTHADMTYLEFIEELKDNKDFETREELLAYLKKKRDFTNSLDISLNNKKLVALLEEMKKREVIFDPTIFILEELIKDTVKAERAKDIIKVAYKYGIEIGLGTDHFADMANGTYIINLFKEVEAMQDCGISNIDLLRAMTIINAKQFGEEKNMGSVDEGKLASILVLGSNPLDDIKNAQDIQHVFKRGKFIR